MPEHSSLAPADISRRAVEAIKTAKVDPDLEKGMRPFLKSAGHSMDVIEKFADALAVQVRNAGLDCDGIKDKLTGEFPKHPKPSRALRNFLLEQRLRLREWVTGNLNLPHAPQLRISKLGPLTDTTLNAYFAYFEELHRKSLGVFDPSSATGFIDKVLDQHGVNALEVLRTWNLTEIQSSLSPALFDEYMAFRERIVSAARGKSDVYRYGSQYPLENLSYLFEQYINASPQNALRVFLFILAKNDPKLIACYESLLRLCFSALKTNEHFVRSVFHFIDENLNALSPLSHSIDPLMIQIFLKIFIETGICLELKREDAVVDVWQPRPHSDFFLSFVFDHCDDPKKGLNLFIRVPVQYVPTSWNTHRLVWPSGNEDFRKMAEVFDQSDHDMSFISAENQRYRDELRQHRRYSTNFSRMRVTDIPGMEDDEVWFYFSSDAHMDPREMRIEIIVNGASIVCFLKSDGELELRDRDIFIPNHPDARKRLSAGDPKSLDAMYCDSHFMDWISDRGAEILEYYVLKYAHALLVLPRSVGGKKSGGSEALGRTGFTLSLTEHETEIYLQQEGSGVGDPSTGRKVAVYHGVDGHIRSLPEGNSHRPEAAAAALERGIVLAPGQTYVKSYWRGFTVTEQQTPVRKMRE